REKENKKKQERVKTQFSTPLKP
ncbi:hypothetical protein EVA_20914, partial [gut metagenome]